MDDMKTPSFDIDLADRAEALAHDIYTLCIKHDCWHSDLCFRCAAESSYGGNADSV